MDTETLSPLAQTWAVVRRSHGRLSAALHFNHDPNTTLGRRERAESGGPVVAVVQLTEAESRRYGGAEGIHALLPDWCNKRLRAQQAPMTLPTEPLPEHTAMANLTTEVERRLQRLGAELNALGCMVTIERTVEAGAPRVALVVSVGRRP